MTPPPQVQVIPTPMMYMHHSLGNLHNLTITLLQYLIDPEDWEVATTYTVGFNLTVQSDRTAPRQTAESDPICLIIKNDILPEGDEVFFCRIISTSDAARVIIGPRNEVPVTIIDRKSSNKVHMYIRTYVHSYACMYVYTYLCRFKMYSK